MSNGKVILKSFSTTMLALTLVATGCSKSNTAGDASSSKPSPSATSSTQSTPAASATPTAQLSGTINLSFPMGTAKPAWEKIAQAYQKINPNVKITIDDKDSATYADWLNAQIAGGNTSADIVVNNTAASYFGENKFVDFSAYLNKTNPYGKKNWKEMMDKAAYTPNGPHGETYTLSIDSFQIPWFYNKNIFKDAGVTPPTNWDELIQVSQKILDKGYQPIALPGNAESFWTGTMGWLLLRYNDQYWKDMEEKFHCTKDDYCFDPEIDGNWKFDVKDKFNDEKANFNTLKVVKALQSGEIGAANPKTKAMYSNFNKLIPKYTGDKTFFEVDSKKAQDMFIQGKAAMYIDLSSFAANFENVMKNQANKFELGYFWDPPMTDKETAVQYVRKQAGNLGFMGAINKSKEQNNLNMDFLMFFASPEGQKVRFAALSDANVAPSGSVLVYGVELPQKWKDTLGPMALEVDNSRFNRNPLIIFSRGLNDEQQSVREFQDLSQQFFFGKIDLDTFTNSLQQSLVKTIPRWLELKKYRPDALDTVSKNPAK